MKSNHNIFLLLLLLFTTSISAQKYFSPTELKHFKQDFKAHLIKKMKKRNVTGLSIAMEIEGQLVLEEGFGYADKSKNIKATNQTEYPIGSVSKIVTSTAILKLCTDGLIDLDKPYTEYVPDFSMKSHVKDEKEFTIRHLLAHYAGLPRLLAKGFMKKEPEPLEYLLARTKDEYLISSPGKVYQYSDWGVDLLSLLVERVSGMSYEAYVENKIFKPLKMTHSYFGPAKQTKGYHHGTETDTYAYSFAGSDGVTSSVSDMLKITQLYTKSGRRENNQFLSDKVVEDALMRQFPDAPLAFDTGIGLMWELLPLKTGHTRVKKAGVHEPFYTYIFFIPELDTSIIICSNSNSSSAIHWDSWGKLYDFIKKKYKASKNSIIKKEKPNYKKVTLTDEQFQKLEGSYSTSIGILNFKRNGNTFDVNLKAEGKKGVGVPYSNGLIKLYVKVLGVKIHAMDVFWKEWDDELIIGEQYESGSRHVLGAKIKTEKIPSSWKAAVGTYKVTNYDANDYRTIETLELLINTDNVLEIKGTATYPREMVIQLGLAPISDELAIIPGYNFDFFGGETVKLNKNKTGAFVLSLSGYQLTRVTK